MSKKSLPWKVSPKADQLVEVGSVDYGVLEIPKKGSLTINEAQFIREHTKDLPDVQQQAIQLAVDISQSDGIDIGEAFEALSGGNIVVPLLLEKPAKKGQSFLLTNVPRAIPKNTAISVGNVTTVLAKDASEGDDRLVIEPLLEAVEGDLITVVVPNKIAQRNTVRLMEFQRQSAETAPLRNAVLATAMLRRIMGNDWTIDQTSEEIPMPVISDLAEFCGKEMNGWIEDEPNGEAEPVTEESLKND